MVSRGGGGESEKISEGVGNVGGKGVTVSTVFLSDYRGDYVKKDTEQFFRSCTVEDVAEGAYKARGEPEEDVA